MKAVVFHGIGDIHIEDVPDPRIEQDTDAIVRLTRTAICGTDLHFIRGTVEGVEPGTILGHEGVSVIASLGPGVRNFKVGDRVVIPSTLGCGHCSYCRAGYYSQCDTVNPNGKLAGTSFFGGPKQTGPFNGLQAELARVPYASVNLVKIPEGVSDDQALMLSDIFPTGYFGADMAEIKPGHSVAVFGCGPVGQFAIASAKLMKAGRIFAIDGRPDRLDKAREQGAEVIDFNAEDPVEVLRQLTGGIGVDCAIDAVGVDAQHAHDDHGEQARQQEKLSQELAPHAQPDGENWVPGNAPAQALEWAVQGLAKAGVLSIIGVYPPADKAFPIGMAMNKNLTIRMGNCNHRKYIPMLLDLVQRGTIDPLALLTQQEPLTSAIAAYEAFDTRQPGWLKVELLPPASAAAR
ncbi:zinc-dependent alcohol dehydrogenase [Bordetella genomosp. 13]|uniref:zinc-dependent alcohol dehydrogenase n=1 Tax=Bordetella genomosp. 13 TaxID=463040 RepID=UPI00119CEDED|nr:zinc-dependent alcohol dehydrogenase [Bordetella genomosp. 13]